jgi:hypothetical protein
MEPTDGHTGTYTFVVRLWQEQREIPDAPALWRGSITDAASRVRRYFGSLDELHAFLAQQCGDANAPAPIGARLTVPQPLGGANT